jgi:hypothetical protein
MNSRKILKFIILTGMVFFHSRLTAKTLGHPDNDVLVRNLRETFKSGIVIPDAASLAGTLDCRAFVAYGNDNDVYMFDEYNFTEVVPGAGFFALMKKKSENNILWLGGYVLNSEGLRETGKQGSETFSTEYVRLDAATGNLIFERSTLDATGGRLESIAEPGLFAESYMICYKRK